MTETARPIPPTVIILMGVAGSGKTTVGKRLAESIKCQFIDADDFHPKTNIDKMSRGIPLNDEDRQPWLESMQVNIQLWLMSATRTVLACSALKESYRKQLMLDPNRMAIVFLQADEAILQARLTDRKYHFMKAEMLKSQLETLEEPYDALVIDASQPPEEIAHKIMRELRLG
jgi:gluconokinase